MPKPQRAPNDDATPIICHTTQDVITAARRYTQADDQEWLCLLSLNERSAISAYRALYGETCAFHVCLNGVLRDVQRWEPARIMTVRHHPHHGPLPLRETLPWVEELYAQCGKMEVPCQYVAVYADGYVFDMDERARQWCQAALPYLSPIAALAGRGFQ